MGNERGPQASWKLGRLTVLLGDSVAYQAGLAVMCALEADYGARPVVIDGAGETGGLSASLASDADALAPGLTQLLSELWQPAQRQPRVARGAGVRPC